MPCLTRASVLVALGIGCISSVLHAQFVDVTSGPLGAAGTSFAVAWGDYDQDGDPDLFITNGAEDNHLLRNDGGGLFVDVTAPPLLVGGGSYGAAWGDYDNDGALDLHVAQGIGDNKLFRNLGGGVFTDVASGDLQDDRPSQGMAWADHDNDGDLDLYVTFWWEPNKLFRNEGNAVFVNATTPPLDFSGRSRSAAWGDYDNDGDLDLYLGAAGGGMLFRNNGGGAFDDVTNGPLEKIGITGVAWGDYDNDGDLDLYLGRNKVSNRLLRNDSGATQDSVVFVDEFIPPVREMGETESVVFLDYDNDGDLDLFCANKGFLTTDGLSNRLMRNEVASTIGPTSPNSPESHDTWAVTSAGPILDEAPSRGAAAADYDGDGDLDLYVSNWGEPNQLLRNDATVPNHWLQVVLVGSSSNRVGIGARVRVVTGGQAQIREISGGSGLYSQDATVAAFGLGVMTTVDTLQVLWPTGSVCTYTNVTTIDQVLSLNEDTCPSEVAVEDGLDRRLTPSLWPGYPNPSRRITRVRYELPDFSHVDLAVYDLQGRLVQVLEDSTPKPAGVYEALWDGRDDGGQDAPAGVYFFRLRAGAVEENSRVVLVD